MNLKEVIKSLELKFTSSNGIPVERAIILDSEFQVIKNWVTENFHEPERT